MTLVKFKERFPSFLDEVFGGDMFETPTNSSWVNSTVPAVNVKENEGVKIDDPSGFVKRLNDMMAKSL